MAEKNPEEEVEREVSEALAAADDLEGHSVDDDEGDQGETFVNVACC